MEEQVQPQQEGIKPGILVADYRHMVEEFNSIHTHDTKYMKNITLLWYTKSLMAHALMEEATKKGSVDVGKEVVAVDKEGNGDQRGLRSKLTMITLRDGCKKM